MPSEEQVLDRIAAVLGVERAEIGAHTQAKDLARWDSMGTMDLVFMLADEYQIELDPNEVNRVNSVASILEILREAGKLT